MKQSNLIGEQLIAVNTEGVVVLMASDAEDGTHVATMEFAGHGEYDEGSNGVPIDQDEAGEIAAEIALRWNAHAELVAALEGMLAIDDWRDEAIAPAELITKAKAALERAKAGAA